jgi:hypothetical protein
LAENHHRSTNGTMETCQNWWIRQYNLLERIYNFTSIYF